MIFRYTALSTQLVINYQKDMFNNVQINEVNRSTIFLKIKGKTG